jgi:predicted RNA-binding Zn-ribbon protein involved in translation (DUF1610 family)
MQDRVEVKHTLHGDKKCEKCGAVLSTRPKKQRKSNLCYKCVRKKE